MAGWPRSLFHFRSTSPNHHSAINLQWVSNAACTILTLVTRWTRSSLANDKSCVLVTLTWRLNNHFLTCLLFALATVSCLYYSLFPVLVHAVPLPSHCSSVVWCKADGKGFVLEYPSISLHAVCRDSSRFPQECLFLMVDGVMGKLWAKRWIESSVNGWALCDYTLCDSCFVWSSPLW